MDAASIRAIQFREKVRGYHPVDVDAFVARVAETVDELQQRVEAAEAAAAASQSRSADSADSEDSLRRTLVLAQRTADLAVQEARQEAARILAEANAEREAIVAETSEHRQRLHADLDEEVRDERERLQAHRAALIADVDALESHLDRERERLRIYFADQLRRVDEGEPSTAARPEMAGPDDVAAPAPRDERPDDVDDRADEVVDFDGGPAVTGAEAGSAEPGNHQDAADEAGQLDNNPPAEAAEDDPFLAELRRAVTDDRPLGPRDDPPVAAPAPEDDGFDLFGQGGDEPGRFGSRLRRRR